MAIRNWFKIVVFYVGVESFSHHIDSNIIKRGFPNYYNYLSYSFQILLLINKTIVTDLPKH